MIIQSKSALQMFWPLLSSYFLNNKIQELQNVCLSNLREQKIHKKEILS